MTFFSRCTSALLVLLTFTLIACGGATSDVPASTSAAVAPSPTTQQSSVATATEARRSSTSEEIVLRVGVSWLGGSLAPPARL